MKHVTHKNACDLQTVERSSLASTRIYAHVNTTLLQAKTPTGRKREGEGEGGENERRKFARRTRGRREKAREASTGRGGAVGGVG